MNKLNKTLLLISAAMLLACDGKESAGPEPTPARDKVPLQIVSGIGSTTRAFDSSWESTDAIGVFTTVAGSGTDATNNPYVVTMSGAYKDENIKYVFNGTAGNTQTGVNATDGYTYTYQGFTPAAASSQIFLPADGSDVDVYAYSPCTNGVTASSPLAISIPTSQTLDNQKATDVLKASLASTASAPIDIDHYTVQLLFRHVLSKVIVKLKAGSGYNASDLSGLTEVKFAGQPVSATFAPITQELTITDADQDVVAYQLQSGDPDFSSETGVIHTYRALLLPNDDTNLSTKTTRKIVFTVGTAPNTITYYYDLYNRVITSGSPIVFEPGKVTVFTITLQATGVSITAAISPWAESSSSPEAPLYEEE